MPQEPLMLALPCLRAAGPGSNRGALGMCDAGGKAAHGVGDGDEGAECPAAPAEAARLRLVHVCGATRAFCVVAVYPCYAGAPVLTTTMMCPSLRMTMRCSILMAKTR